MNNHVKIHCIILKFYGVPKHISYCVCVSRYETARAFEDDDERPWTTREISFMVLITPQVCWKIELLVEKARHAPTGRLIDLVG